jgi:hypothetical protein
MEKRFRKFDTPAEAARQMFYQIMRPIGETHPFEHLIDPEA